MTPIGNPPAQTAQARPLDATAAGRSQDRRRAGHAVLFPVTPRSLEEWSVTWRMVNGKAVGETSELFAVAQAKLDAAPVTRGGRRAVAEQQAA
jgi:hypothetical protein